MLTLDNITCMRGGRALFRHLGLTLGDSCLTIVRGQNGSGKTSLLKIAAGLLRPQAGQVLYANTPVVGMHYPEYCSLIHYLGHEYALKPELTVYENLHFWAKVKGDPARLAAALHFWGMEEVADLPFGRLSAGWKKKAALSRLLLSDAEIWLLDEPLVNLDAEAQANFALMAGARLQEGGSILLTSHDDTLPFAHYHTLDLGDWA